MSLEVRLARCIAYRDEAMKHPITNKFYIADLELSIKMFSNAIQKPIYIQKGWEDEES